MFTASAKAICQRCIRRCGAVLVFVLLWPVAASAAGTPTPTHSAAVGEFCKQAVPDIDATWEGAPTNGFDVVNGFSNPPSIYESYWRLKILGALHPFKLATGVTVTTISASVARGLFTVVQNDDDGIGQMENLQYALRMVSASDAVRDEPYARRIIMSLRAGHMYSATPNGTATWGSTLDAAEIAKEERFVIPLPSESTAFTDFQLSSISKTTDTNENAATILLFMALEYPHALVRIRSEVESFLVRSRTEALKIAPWQGSLLELSEMRSVAQSLDLSFALPPRGWISEAALRDGLVDSDPQTTYYALTLGYRAPRDLRATVDTGLSPNGWLDTGYEPSAISTIESVKVLRFCNNKNHFAPAKSDARRWIGEFSSSPKMKSISPSDLYATLELASFFRLHLTDIESSNAISAADEIIATDIRNKSVTTQVDAGLALSSLTDLRSPPSSNAMTALTKSCTVSKQEISMAHLEVLDRCATVLDDPVVKKQLSGEALRLRFGSGFALVASLPMIDEYSSSVGRDLCSSCGNGVSAFEAFETAEGPDFQLYQTPSSDEVSQDSLYYSTLLLSRRSTRDPVPYF
jgi:hypothetical protein